MSMTIGKRVEYKGKVYTITGPEGWHTSGVKVACKGEYGTIWRKLRKGSKVAKEVHKFAEESLGYRAIS